MIDPLHTMLSPEARALEEAAEAEISDSFNRYVQEVAERVYGAASTYCGDDAKATVQVALTLCESIVIGVLDRLPIAAGNEVKLMQEMKVNVKRRMAQARLLRGPAKGRA